MYKKILSDDENNSYSDDDDEDSLSDSNIIYNNCDEYSSIKDNLFCDYCEKIYKNTLKMVQILKKIFAFIAIN